MFGKIIYVQESSQCGVSEPERRKHSASLSQNAVRHYRTDKILIFDFLLEKKKQTGASQQLISLQEK